MQSIRSVKIAPGVIIGGKLPVLIMGPCVIESERHALMMAKLVKQAAKRVGWPVIFKASYDKANRTSHQSFRGNGMEEGLRILARVKDATGLPVTTALTKPKSWTIFEFGESQYSACSTLTFNKQIVGSSSPFGNHAFKIGFQSSSIFARSLTTAAVPETET